ncbi:hypothetical protein HQ36_05515 [Porphyromonas gingivicanis]|uniref:Uncharacterized protein n=1 Tax=Porphyromonas gingivicanis TaxID=266762 RepID=A0A0A2G354_9PORP|nr:hypothetical protein HQ36_05515 [Porphyromonas gingivicanis]
MSFYTPDMQNNQLICSKITKKESTLFCKSLYYPFLQEIGSVVGGVTFAFLSINPFVAKD